MSTAEGFMKGHSPKIAIEKANPEAEKYGRMWEHEEYRKYAPGEQLAQVFLAQAKPKPGSEVIDFGCGTGRGALMLALIGRMKVTMIDFVRNSLDPEIQQMLTTQSDCLKFIKAALEHLVPSNAKY